MATHPSLEYLLVAAVAAAGCFLATPIARALAIKWRAIATPRDRDVHAVAIPRMGGVAMFAGLVIALYVASRLPTLHEAFRPSDSNSGSEIAWILLSAGLLCLIGALDDRYELDSVTKLAGQVLATGIMVTLGKVQLVFLYLPFGQTTFVLGQDLAIPVTILLTVLTINAVNFIDGLDGLAAGVTAIGALAFFLFSYHLGSVSFANIAAAPTLLSAALAGTCIGFLPHNFFPARIFMGDTGSMVAGLMLSASAITATTNVDPQGFTGDAVVGLPLLLPLIIPLSVLGIPFVDLLLAVVRRLSKGQSPFAPDKKHLHHRLLALGHSHRRAVLLLYFWAALISFGGALLSISSSRWVLVVMVAIGIGLGILLLIVPRIAWRLRVRARQRAATSAQPSRVDAAARPDRTNQGDLSRS